MTHHLAPQVGFEPSANLEEPKRKYAWFLSALVGS